MLPVTHCSLLSLAGPATRGQRTLGLIYQMTLIPSPSDRRSRCAKQIRPGCSGCCPSACDGGELGLQWEVGPPAPVQRHLELCSSQAIGHLRGPLIKLIRTLVFSGSL